MFPVLVGVSSALIYGSADFLGGLASRRISPLRVTAISSATGAVILLLVLPVAGGVWSVGAVVLGALSGVTGAIAITLLYACLALGPMSILSPVTAVVSAIVPLSVGLVQGDRLRAPGYVGIALALIAVVLVGFVREQHAVRPSLRGLAMAVGSGAMIGLFLVIIDRTPADSGLLPLLVNRGVNSAVMFAAVGVVALVSRRRDREFGREREHGRERARERFGAGDAGGARGRPDARADATSALPRRGWRAGLGFAVACGVADATANAGLLLGLRISELSVMSVLTALYPAGTIILAAVVLRERIAIVQYIGLALAVGASALFAIG
jgi:drug/metabolite transporter (DMT)-like permease